MDKFSVLMSVYYKENPKYLEESINSVINQTLLPNEIVIVKDGKLTQELDRIIEGYALKYSNLFKIVELKKNLGLGNALREGIKSCSHDIIARMDTDDICSNDRFEKQLNYLTLNKDISVVGSNIDEFEGNINNIISKRIVPNENNEIIRFCKTRNPMNHMTVMYRKKDVLAVGNYEDLLWNEDYYLWAKMISQGYKMHNMMESLVFVRVGDEMFERRGGIQYAKKDIELQKRLLDLGITNNVLFIKNTVTRVVSRLLPNTLRKKLYMKLLRKSLLIKNS